MNSELDKFFYPKSIAVIGASSKRGSLSWELVNNILNYGYNGKLFPVNPKSESVHSIKAYKSLTDIGDDVDLAIIMVPRDFVLPAIDECHRKKVDAVVVITAGFKEVGGEGLALEKELIEKIQKYKIRLVGPNCMGIINTHPDVRLNGTFAIGNPLHGGIGFVSQSGALGAAVLKTVRQNDIGLSHFVSIGNKADISGNVVLNYWKDDDNVKVITAYFESFGNPRKFMEITREISKKKPILVIKSARTKAGAKAASSHTGALASSDTVVNAFLEQGGVIRVNTIEEMFDLAKAFDSAVLPNGNRVGILTNAGGPAILTVDESEKSGLEIPELSPATIEKLKEFAPPEAALQNPVDLLPPATASMWEQATELMLRDDNIDSLIVILGPPLMLDTIEIAHSIIHGAKNTKKTVMLVLMSQDDIIPKLREFDPRHPPIFRYPEGAARAVGEMVNYKKWQNKPPGNYKKFEVNKETVKKILSSQKLKGEFYIPFGDVREILKAYGLPVVESIIAKDIDESLKVANEIGYPVVVKAIGKELVHKTEIGGVKLDVKNDNELRDSQNEIIAKLSELGVREKLEDFLIQPYVKGGIETILGVFKDSKAGHLLMFGLGGIMVEVFKDVKFKLLPVTDVEADDLVKSVTCYKLLQGIRGNPPVDIEFVKDNLMRLSQLIEDFPEFSEIDFNPFVFKPEKKSCRILDARMKVVL